MFFSYNAFDIKFGRWINEQIKKENKERRNKEK